MFSFNRIYFNTGVILFSLSLDYQPVLNCIKCIVKFSMGHKSQRHMFVLMLLLSASFFETCITLQREVHWDGLWHGSFSMVSHVHVGFQVKSSLFA